MSTRDKVKINKLPTGVPGLDEIVGGGLPEFSFNIIAGAPGSGKTTLAHQFVFANASLERPALYFTVLGESAIKMLRYQQQYTFFDPAKLPDSIRFINLSDLVLEQDLKAVLAEIIRQVPEDVRTLMIVGHNPAVGQLSAVLTGTELVFPAAAIAVIGVAQSWAELAMAGNELQASWTPAVGFAS